MKKKKKKKKKPTQKNDEWLERIEDYIRNDHKEIN